MAAKGVAVSAPRGAYYMLDSGDPKEDERDAEELKKQLGKEAIICPLGGAAAYDLPPSTKKFLADHCGY